MATATQLAQAEADYLDNAGYAASQSISQARAFETACRKLLVLLPSSMTKGANSVTNRVDLISQELKTVRDWLEQWGANEVPGPKVTRAGFRTFRG